MENDVKQESSPELEQAIASSPEAIQDVKQQIQESQTQPAETQGVTQEQETQQAEEARIPYSRLKEVVDEKNWYKQQMESLLQRQPNQQPLQQQPTELGQTPEEREFWRMIDQRADKRAEEKMKQYEPLIEATRAELSRIGVDLFRKAHPDIKPNSPEEVEIAQRISYGFTPDEAYKVVMYDKKLSTTETQKQQQVKQKIEAKRNANVENSSSVPLQAQTPPKRTLKETAEYYLKLAQEGKL